MAGGTWEFQNKKQPGIYINFKSSPTTLATIGDRGIVAIAKELDWGDSEELIYINSISDVYTKLGYDVTNPNVKFVQQIFRGSNRTQGAQSIIVGRLDQGALPATATIGELTATAKYGGVKGNSISVSIAPDLDTLIPGIASTGNLTFSLVSAQSAGTAVDGTVNLLTSPDGAAWSNYGDSPYTLVDGKVTINNVPVAQYKFEIVTVDSAYDLSTAEISPQSITISNGDMPRDLTFNATVAEVGQTGVTPTDPNNPAPIPQEEKYAIYQVNTIVDNVIQNSQRVGSYTSETEYEEAKISDLQNNDWIIFSGDADAELTPTAGITLTGGANGNVSPTAAANFLNLLEPISFNVLIYDGTNNVTKAAYATFIQRLAYQSGRYSQLVVSNYHTADEILVISVDNGYVLNDDTTIAPEEATWWVGGVTANASVSQSLTYASHPDAVQAFPRLNEAELDTSIDQGSLVFIEEFGVTKIMTDINTFTSFEPNKGRVFSKNRTVRVVTSIANDIYATFAQYYIGVVDNTPVGRNLFKAEIASYLLQLEGNGAIQNFNIDDIEVLPGNDVDSIIVNVAIQVVGAVEKVYMTVTVTAEETAA